APSLSTVSKGGPASQSGSASTLRVASRGAPPPRSDLASFPSAVASGSPSCVDPSRRASTARASQADEPPVPLEAGTGEVFASGDRPPTQSGAPLLSSQLREPHASALPAK